MPSQSPSWLPVKMLCFFRLVLVFQVSPISPPYSREGMGGRIYPSVLLCFELLRSEGNLLLKTVFPRMHVQVGLEALSVIRCCCGHSAAETGGRPRWKVSVGSQSLGDRCHLTSIYML